ncbi:hypothetical protein [Candidatus Villigracilis saccharophilus]|uniref:hypothetical protein n=1 Tax=Candidatus Villigracilis saccharophilus TaxID=3140684 RepID=UPI003136FC33|nr:hypothetical protein [Anaerolineales bacterium]
MKNNFSETDWKILSRLKPLALDHLCQLILGRSGDIIARAHQGGHHDCYLDLYRHIHESDETMSRCFDDFKRSQALVILANWRQEKLITDEEFATFSPDTRVLVDMLLKQR